jgi:hypothetical protein
MNNVRAGGVDQTVGKAGLSVARLTACDIDHLAQGILSLTGPVSPRDLPAESVKV